MTGKQFPRIVAAACAAVLLAAGAASAVVAGKAFVFKASLPSIHNRIIADGAYVYLSSDAGVAGITWARHGDITGTAATWRYGGQAFAQSFARHPVTGKVYAWGPFGVVTLPERSQAAPAAALEPIRDDWGYDVDGSSRLAVDAAGRLWFAVQKTGNDGLPRDAHYGVYLWDGSSLTRLVEAPAYAVYADANGDVYASTEQGVHRWASGSGAPELLWNAAAEGRWPGGYARVGGTLYAVMRDYANTQADPWNTTTELYRWDGGLNAFVLAAVLRIGPASDFTPVAQAGTLWLRGQGESLVYAWDGSALTDVTGEAPFNGFSYVAAMAFAGDRLYLSGQQGLDMFPVAVYEGGALTKHTAADFQDPTVPTFAGSRAVTPGGLWQSFVPGGVPQSLRGKALLFGPGGGASLRTLPADRTIAAAGAFGGADFLLLSGGEVGRHGEDGAVALHGAFGTSASLGWVDPSKGAVWAARNFTSMLGGKPWIRSALALYDITGARVAYGMRNPSTGGVLFPAAESEWTYDEVYGSGMKHGVRAFGPVPGEDAVMIAAVDMQTSGGASGDLVVLKYSYGANTFTPSPLPRAVSDASGSPSVRMTAGQSALYLLVRKSDGSQHLFVYRDGAWSEGPDLSAVLAAGETVTGIAAVPVPAADRLILRVTNAGAAGAVYVLNMADGTSVRLADGDTPLNGEGLHGVQVHAPGKARVWFGNSFGVKYCDLEFETQSP